MIPGGSYWNSGSGIFSGLEPEAFAIYHFPFSIEEYSMKNTRWKMGNGK